MYIRVVSNMVVRFTVINKVFAGSEHMRLVISMWIRHKFELCWCLDTNEKWILCRMKPVQSTVHVSGVQQLCAQLSIIKHRSSECMDIENGPKEWHSVLLQPSSAGWVDFNSKAENIWTDWSMQIKLHFSMTNDFSQWNACQIFILSTLNVYCMQNCKSLHLLPPANS